MCITTSCWRSSTISPSQQSRLPPALRARIVIKSAGTHSSPGDPATSEATEAAARRGLDLRGHRAQPLTAELVRRSDLVLGMERHHVDAVLALAPASRDRVHLVSEFHAEPGAEHEGIHDPMGGSPEIYEECLLRIERHLVRILPHLEERAVGERRS